MHSKIDKFLNFMETETKYQPFVRSIKALYRDGNDLAENYAEKFLALAENTLGDNAYEALANGYVAFVMDVSRSQLRYEVTGSYANQSYAEVYEATYDNESFMNLYHWGVFASTFLWGHHIKITHFFNTEFLPLLEQKPDTICFDLGAGSGIWSWQLLKQNKTATVDMVDISKTSAKKLEDLMRKDSLIERVRVHLDDATSWRPDENQTLFDAGISCFLLEHLEKPKLLFENISRLLKPRAFTFVTAALTAAEVDHIYEFKRESEILTMAERAGLRVIEMKSLGPSNYPEESKFFPRSIAMILSKRAGAIW